MKSNEELQKNVVDAINWEPLLQAAEIGVMVQQGVVTLTGSVNIYAKKAEAEHAAKNVIGVKKVFENINVICNANDKRTDAEIMDAIQNAFNWHWDIPTDKVTILVENSWVYLSGELKRYYQKEAAKNVVCHLIGITGVTNDITITTSSKDLIIQKDIETAISHIGTINNKDLVIYVSDNIASLIGQVDTWSQKNEAGRIAWITLGVKQVKNDLYVAFKE
jgi:osmotically-inducible protein OsmY